MIDQYTEAANDALEMIREAGKSYPIKRVATVADPVAGTVTETVTEGTLVAIILPAKTTPNQAVAGSLDNAFIAAMTRGRARYVLAAANDAAFEPDAGDVFTLENAAWEVRACSPLSPAGTPIVYKLGIILV